MVRIGVAVAIALALSCAGGVRAQEAISGRPHYHWIMHCQGCHGVNAEGTPFGAPALAGEVSRFLHNKEGRAYLGRVPGVAFVPLPDADVANLLNWMITHFDAKNVPKSFAPYSQEEVHALRADALISRAKTERQRVLKLIGRNAGP